MTKEIKKYYIIMANLPILVYGLPKVIIDLFYSDFGFVILFMLFIIIINWGIFMWILSIEFLEALL